MILPTTYLAALLLLVLSIFCLGSWQNAQKLTGKWRFELFYYDFSVGVALIAVIAAFTFGSMNPSDLTFQDNFLLTGYRKMANAAFAGVVFNLGNLLLLAAIAVAGMGIAFPMAVGFALVIGVIWQYLLNQQGSPGLLFGGALLVLGAVIAAAFTHSERLADKAAQDKGPPKYDPRTKTIVRPPSGVKGIVVSLLSGLFLALFYPLLDLSRTGDDAIGPYGIALLFAGGVLFSTLLYNPFLMNFPVVGEPIHFRDFFKGTRRQHLTGVLGGIVFGTGVIASLVAANAPKRLQVGSGLSLALSMAPAVLGALWGLLVWRELGGSSTRVKSLAVAVLILFITGLILVSMAPSFGTS
jgi:glucose uptake protein